MGSSLIPDDEKARRALRVSLDAERDEVIRLRALAKNILDNTGGELGQLTRAQLQDKLEMIRIILEAALKQ